MSKLLSDEELEQEILRLTAVDGKEPSHAYRLLDSIKGQKLAHANVVIGNDPSYCYPDSITWGDTEYSHNAIQYGRDELRAEQRQRNSL